MTEFKNKRIKVNFNPFAYIRVGGTNLIQTPKIYRY